MYFVVVPSVGWEYVHVNVYFQVLASQLHDNWTFSAAVHFSQAVKYLVFILYATFCKFVLLWSVACVSQHHFLLYLYWDYSCSVYAILVRSLHYILLLSFPYAMTATLPFISAVFPKYLNSYPPICLIFQICLTLLCSVSNFFLIYVQKV